MFGLSCCYSSGLMALPNNALCVYVEGGHNEQAGNDLFDHLASHIWICATFITTAGLPPFCIDITQRGNVSLLSQPNVSAEVPLFPSHRRWPFMLSWPGNVAWKRCVCVSNESTIHIPLSLSCSKYQSWLPSPCGDGRQPCGSQMNIKEAAES